jgi:hypothetical protein
MTSEVRCSEASVSAGEPIGATATEAESWLLVEVPGPWLRDVSDGSGLPPRAQAAVQAWLERTPSSRLQFVRRPGRGHSGRLLAFLVRAGEVDADARRVELGDLDELDPADPTRWVEAEDAQLVLVCGHGTRDACCARRGTAVFGGLAPHLGQDELWMSSHQGGHRFAPNVLVLPAGIQLGRVGADEAPGLVAGALLGRVDLARYRGRTAYPRDVQAAERAVRDATGLDRIGDLRLLGVDGDRVHFRGPDGKQHTAVVESALGPVVPASCGAEPEPQRVLTAHVL